MGSRYCAINSQLGPPWGQKFLDLRSRDFCPHLEPSGELIKQYRPPMSVRYITLWHGCLVTISSMSVSQMRFECSVKRDGKYTVEGLSQLGAGIYQGIGTNRSRRIAF